MRRRRSPVEEEGEGDLDPESEEEDDEPSGPPRRRGRRAPRPHPVRPWRSGEADQEEEPPEEDLIGPGPPWSWFHRPKRPVFFRARDSLYFEPLVAIAIVLLLLVSLYAYAQNWPPAYVIESDSMQHGSHDVVGLINTGDLVIAEKLDPSQIVPYVVGAQSGYKTYGEFGDVILYHPNGSTAPSPVIHRAIVYIEYQNGTYSIPELAGLPCGMAKDAVYNVTEHASGCGPTGLTHGRLVLYRIGWSDAVVNISLDPSDLGSQSGYLTMGDNNLVAGTPPEGLPDEPSITPLVQSGWIIGVARGMIPWFGSIKLLLSGEAGMVPSESWEFLGITIVGLLLAAAGIHYALRAEGIEDERRRELEEEEGALEEERPHRRWRFLRRAEEDDEEEEDEGSSQQEQGRTLLQRLQPRYWRSGRQGGRPPPAIRKGGGSGRRRRRRSGPEDDDL